MHVAWTLQIDFSSVIAIVSMAKKTGMQSRASTELLKSTGATESFMNVHKASLDHEVERVHT